MFCAGEFEHFGSLCSDELATPVRVEEFDIHAKLSSDLQDEFFDELWDVGFPFCKPDPYISGFLIEEWQEILGFGQRGHGELTGQVSMYDVEWFLCLAVGGGWFTRC